MPTHSAIANSSPSYGTGIGRMDSFKLIGIASFIRMVQPRQPQIRLLHVGFRSVSRQPEDLEIRVGCLEIVALRENLIIDDPLVAMLPRHSRTGYRREDSRETPTQCNHAKQFNLQVVG